MRPVDRARGTDPVPERSTLVLTRCRTAACPSPPWPCVARIAAPLAALLPRRARDRPCLRSRVDNLGLVEHPVDDGRRVREVGDRTGQHGEGAAPAARPALAALARWAALSLAAHGGLARSRLPRSRVARAPPHVSSRAPSSCPARVPQKRGSLVARLVFALSFPLLFFTARALARDVPRRDTHHGATRTAARHAPRRDTHRGALRARGGRCGAFVGHPRWHGRSGRRRSRRAAPKQHVTIHHVV